jgi:hypothetical protein
MDFDLKKFKSAKLEPRQEAVPVPDLKDFFKEGAEPVWIVRGLTGHELGKVNEAAEKNKNLSAILEGLISPDMHEKVQALKTDLGLDDSVPNDVVRRLEMFTIGSVDPAIDHETAVKFCTHFPVEFFSLTNRITVLTGKGAEVKKKQQSSGEASK